MTIHSKSPKSSSCQVRGSSIGRRKNLTGRCSCELVNFQIAE
jgi:hypothetical protein